MWYAIGALAVAVLVVLLYLVGRRGGPLTPGQARAEFATRTAALHDDFFQAAAASGKPRGLRWVDCEWDDALAFGRERATGRLVALAGITIRFEAIPGSDMEGLPAVGNLRHGCAVFVHDGRSWHANGRAVFNLTPDETLAHFHNDYERLDSQREA
jgi:hypothetical protein